MLHKSRTLRSAKGYTYSDLLNICSNMDTAHRHLKESNLNYRKGFSFDLSKPN